METVISNEAVAVLSPGPGYAGILREVDCFYQSQLFKSR
jgi:hypothetical protein